MICKASGVPFLISLYVEDVDVIALDFPLWEQ